MKEPTTPYCISINKNRQIDRAFLLSEGWLLTEEYPLFEVFTHSKNDDLKCSIGLYGGFSITELHWLNKDPETEFSAMNPSLTKEDYHATSTVLDFVPIMMSLQSSSARALILLRKLQRDFCISQFTLGYLLIM